MLRSFSEYQCRKLTAKQGIFGSSFFDFDSSSRTLITANNFGIFWIIALPLTLVVLVSSSIWPSLISKIAKQEVPTDWIHEGKHLAVLATFSRMAGSVGHTLHHCSVIVQTMFGRATFRERFVMWFRSGTVRHGMASV